MSIIIQSAIRRMSLIALASTATTSLTIGTVVLLLDLTGIPGAI